MIRTGFLKRFESSVAAFEISSDRLMKKLLAFLEVHSETDAEKKRFEAVEEPKCRDPRVCDSASVGVLGRRQRRSQ